MKQLNEAIRQKDFSRAGLLVQKYLRGKLGKVYMYPVPEVFIPSGGSEMTGVRFFLDGNKSIRLNWKRSINYSQGLLSLDYWDGSKIPQPYPTTHIKFDEEQSLAKILPMVVDFLNGKIETNKGIYVNESIDTQNINLVFDFRQSNLTEAAYTSGELAKTVSNIINALKSNVQIADQYKEGGNKKYGPRWDKAANEIKKQYPSLFKKQGAKIIIDPTDVAKIDAAKILAAISGGDEAIAFTVSSGGKEEQVVEGTSEADIERMTYEEQLDALKSGMKLLMSNATNSMWVGGRGGCLSGETILNIRKNPEPASNE